MYSYKLRKEMLEEAAQKEEVLFATMTENEVITYKINQLTDRMNNLTRLQKALSPNANKIGLEQIQSEVNEANDEINQLKEQQKRMFQMEKKANYVVFRITKVNYEKEDSEYIEKTFTNIELSELGNDDAYQIRYQTYRYTDDGDDSCFEPDVEMLNLINAGRLKSEHRWTPEVGIKFIGKVTDRNGEKYLRLGQRHFIKLHPVIDFGNNDKLVEMCRKYETEFKRLLKGRGCKVA